MFTSWKSYVNRDESNSWSVRVTGSGHVTVSAILQEDGTLKAFPPLASENAFPVFLTLNATAGGKITEKFSGVYEKNNWERSCKMEQARAELWWIFLGHYRQVREKQARARADQERFIQFVDNKIETPDGSIELSGDDPLLQWPNNFHAGYLADVLVRLVGEESTYFANEAVGTLQTLRTEDWLVLVEIPQPEAPKFFVANFVGNKNDGGGKVVYRQVAIDEIAAWKKE